MYFDCNAEKLTRQTTTMKAQWTSSRTTLSRFCSIVLICSLRENESAFDRYKIRPRILRNVDQIDMSMEILGTKVIAVMAS